MGSEQTVNHRRASVAGQLHEKYGDDPAYLDAIKGVPGVMFVAAADSVSQGGNAIWSAL